MDQERQWCDVFPVRIVVDCSKRQDKFQEARRRGEKLACCTLVLDPSKTNLDISEL